MDWLGELSVRQLCDIVRQEGLCPVGRTCADPDETIPDCASCMRAWDALAELERRGERFNRWRDAVKLVAGR